MPDDNSDNDSAYDCNDGCPYDTGKTASGVCGCNNPDDDLDGDGKADCLSQSVTETTTYYHTDPAGTPLAITDSEGEVIWQATYLPFGEEYSVDGVLENNRRFIGKEKDEETGLTYFGARYLLNERFLSTDPVRVVNVGTEEINSTILADPQRLNLYAYGLNNPYRYVDPDGNSPTAVALSPLLVTPIPGARIVYGAAVAGSAVYAGYKTYKSWQYLNENNKKDTPPVPDTTPGRKTKGKTKQWEKAGGMDAANEDFDSFDPENVRDIPNGGRVGELKNSEGKIIVRPNSSDKRPTLEIQHGNKKTKVRYND